MLSRLSCVIDTQNVSPIYLEPIITHITQHIGRISAGRAYMDIMSPNPTWVEQSVNHGIDPIGVYCHPGKNSVDHYLVSDVYLSIENFDGLVLVSNDSDFRKLSLDINPFAPTYLYCRESSPIDLTSAFDTVFYYDTLPTYKNHKKRKRD